MVALTGSRSRSWSRTASSRSRLTEPQQGARRGRRARRGLSRPRETVQGWKFTEWGDEFPVDVPLGQARAGGLRRAPAARRRHNPDKLRMDESAVPSCKPFLDAGKPVAAICHGPWTLIEAGEVRGRRIDVLAVAPDRPRERRGAVGGPGGRGGRQPGHQPQAGRHPGVQPRDDSAVRPHARRAGAASGGRVTPATAVGGGAQRAPPPRGMEQRPFGPGAARGPVIGQGTWYIDDAHRLNRGRRPAPRPRPRNDPHRHRRDVRGRRGRGRRGDRRSARGGFLVSKVLPGNASAARRWRPASGRSRACAPIGWIATSCTGRLAPRSTFAASRGSASRARSCPGG